jgi:hypothetical protein
VEEVEEVERPLLRVVAEEVVVGVDDGDEDVNEAVNEAVNDDLDALAPQPPRARTSHAITAAAPPARLGIPTAWPRRRSSGR